ncbi:hypothetical protein QVD17_36372 [Tagetes erecta]|uniref:Uncharacterized protein n=1 Tax=Tagetes erecta TaxID=13708 RepID=A0AAD8JU87_TARER|nr:hypothetical protein QVD17_36372 [Tagetes erecta]
MSLPTTNLAKKTKKSTLAGIFLFTVILVVASFQSPPSLPLPVCKKQSGDSSPSLSLPLSVSNHPRCRRRFHYRFPVPTVENIHPNGQKTRGPISLRHCGDPSIPTPSPPPRPVTETVFPLVVRHRPRHPHMATYAAITLIGERSGDEEEGRGTTSSPPRRKRGGPRALLLSSPSRFLLVIAQTSPLPRPRAHMIFLLVTPLLHPLPAPL